MPEINSNTDVISGQHTPTGETMWSIPNDLSDDALLEELTKEALGLTDIPASSESSNEIISEVPKDNFVIGDDEQTEYFGANEDVPDLPPMINKYQSIGANMLKELKDLEKKVLKAGYKEKISELIKESQTVTPEGVAGGWAGGTAGSTAGGLLGGLLGAPMAIPGAVSGGILGAIKGYFGEEKATKAEQLNRKVTSLEDRLRSYGVIDTELEQLREGRIKPGYLNAPLMQRNKIREGDYQTVTSIAQQYVDAYAEYKQFLSYLDAAHNKYEEEKRQKQEQGRVQLHPVEQEGTKLDTSRAPMTRRVSQYLFPEDDNVRSVQMLINSILSDTGTFDASQYTGLREQFPGGIEVDGLWGNETTKAWNAVVPQYAIGGKNQPQSSQEALTIIKQVVEKLPDKETPDVVAPEQPTPESELSYQGLPAHVVPSPTNIAKVLQKLSSGDTEIESDLKISGDRIKRITERYIRQIVKSEENNDKTQVNVEHNINYVAQLISSSFSDEIIKELNNTKHTKDPPGRNLQQKTFNSLVWTYLRRVWADSKDATFRKNPTEHSINRRNRKVQRQENRWSGKEASENRAGAKIASRQWLLDGLEASLKK